VGIGTTFSFILTVPISNMVAMNPSDAGALQGRDASLLAAAARPLQILLAEDNGTNQLVFCKLAKNLGVEITVAQNGREAVARASDGAFDVIFMDMQMPLMGGLEATRIIRERGGALAAIPIIALTANAFADDIKACRDAGMNDFITKPIRKNILIEKLAKVVGGRKRLRGPDAAPAAYDELPPVSPAAVAMTNVGPFLDRVILNRLIGDIEIDGVRATVEMYLAETHEQLALLKTYSSDRDGTKIKSEAHKLTGASRIFGLNQVSELAETLEQSAPDMAPDAYRKMLEFIESSVNAARAELKAALAEAAA
jgi:CheY-like chemotaxis protein